MLFIEENGSVKECFKILLWRNKILTALGWFAIRTPLLNCLTVPEQGFSLIAEDTISVKDLIAEMNETESLHLFQGDNEKYGKALG